MYREKFYHNYLKNKNGLSLNDMERLYAAPFLIDKKIADILPKDRNAHILDIGCGYGRLLKYLRDRGYKNIYGIDIGAAQVEFLKKKDVNVINADVIDYLNSCIQEKKTFACITMFDFMEHLNKEEIVLLLQKLYVVLADTGMLIIRVPNSDAIYNGRIMYGDFTHETNFTAHSINQLFRTYNFHNINIYPIYPIVHGFRSFIRYCGFKVLEIIYMLGSSFETGKLTGFMATQNILAVIKKRIESE
jgi:2-polyprenyl-3-methyl-5-hydroxy-6-metoxy-1,4-benzoquinol methylase